jgi:hypothetical protein
MPFPMPCHEYAFLKATSQGHGRVVAGRRHVGDLPAFALFVLPCPVPGSLLLYRYGITTVRPAIQCTFELGPA